MAQDCCTVAVGKILSIQGENPVSSRVQEQEGDVENGPRARHSKNSKTNGPDAVAVGLWPDSYTENQEGGAKPPQEA